MKDLNELLQQFDDIQEFPINEEIVGAYVEGNLAGAELRDLQNFLNSDDYLYHIVNDINNTDMVLDNNISFPKWDIEGPNIFSPNKDSFISVNLEDNLDLPSCVLGNGESIFDIDFSVTDMNGENNIHPLEDTHNDDANSGFNHSLNDLY